MHAADVAIDITEVDSSAMYPLGQEFYSPATSQASVTTSKPAANTGPRVWVYVFNDDTSSFTAGLIVARDAATATYDGIIAPVDSNPMRILGVAQHTIAAGSYGWILKRGVGLIEAGSETIDEDEVVAVSASNAGHGMEGGSIAADAHEAAVIGFATADAAEGTTASCWINCPG